MQQKQFEMKDENKAFLDTNRYYYDWLVKVQTLKQLDGATRSGLLRVIHEEFSPDYLTDLWCGNCVAEMIRYCYIQYDKWIEAQSIQV